MKLIFLFLLSFSVISAEVFCQAKQNTTVIWEVSGVVEKSIKLSIGHIEHYEVLLENKDDNQFILEIYDSYTPSRQYLEGEINYYNNGITWSLWTREILLDVQCRSIASLYYE